MNDELLDDDLGKHKREKKNFNPRPAILWGIIFLLGHLFKFQHYPGSMLLYVLGSGGLCGYAFSCIVKFKGKNVQSNILAIFSLFWMGKLVYGALYDGGYPINMNGLMIFLVVMLLSAAFHLFAKKMKKRLMKN